MEQYFAESPYDNKRTISLNLADLKSENTENSHHPNTRTTTSNPKVSASIRDPDEFLRQSISDISQKESSYQQNLSVLLSKSQGTKYESTVRKLMNMECADVIFSPHGADFKQQERKKNTESTEKSRPLQPKRSHHEQQEALKYLAKPVARKIWEGSPSKADFVSTNCKGRQRPPPKGTYTAELAEDWNYAPKPATLNRHRSHVQTPTGRRSSGGERKGSARKGAGRKAVSIRDFSQWLEDNKEWKERIREKKELMEMQHTEEELSTLTKPKITSRSIKLADIARRKHDRLVMMSATSGQHTGHLYTHHHAPVGFDDEDNDCSGTAAAETENESYVEGGAGPRARSDYTKDLRFSFEEQKGLPSGSQSARQMPIACRNDDDSAATWSGNVFDRLYSDYRKYEHRNLDWEPPQLPFSFSPTMCKKSKELIEKRKDKIVSIVNRRSSFADSVPFGDDAVDSSRRRHRSMSPADRRTYAEQRHMLRMSTPDPYVLKKRTWIPGGQLSLPDSAGGGKMYHEDTQGYNATVSLRDGTAIAGAALTSSSSPGAAVKSGPGRITAKENAMKVNDILEEARTRSRARADAINRYRTQKAIEVTQTLPDGTKMFQPQVSNSETRRILESRITESFEDRLFRSVDNYQVRQRLAREPKPTPGPGQYSNVLDCNRYTRSPLKRAEASSPIGSVRSSSPGRGGFSFGKQPRGVLFPTPQV